MHSARSLAAGLLLLPALAALPAHAGPPPPLACEVGFTPVPGGVDLQGWAVSACGDVALDYLVDGRVTLKGGTNQPRPDIAARFPGVPGAEYAGFGGRVGIGELDPGRHRLQVIARSPKCGAERMVLNVLFDVAAPPRRPLRAREVALLVFASGILLAAGYGLSRLPSRESVVAGTLPLVLLSWLAAAVAIVLGPRLATPIIKPAAGLLGPLANWDGGWYTLIAQHGYDRLQTYAFFPLWPGLLRAAGRVGVSAPVAGGLFSLLFSLLAVALLRRERRDLAVLFLFSLPYAFFFSAAYSEALFLFLGVAYLHALKAGHPAGAFLAGAFASLTRPQGLFLALFAVGPFRRGNRRAALAAAAGSAAGFLAWCAYLWQRTGDPFVFTKVQIWFGRSMHFSAGRLVDATLRALRQGNSDIWGNLVMLAVVAAACAGLLLERRVAEAVFSALVFGVGLGTNSPNSLCRYALGAFSALLYLGEKWKPGRAAYACLAGLGVVKLVLAFWFGQGWFMG